MDRPGIGRFSGFREEYEKKEIEDEEGFHVQKCKRERKGRRI
jgi:hypothetical protein